MSEGKGVTDGAMEEEEKGKKKVMDMVQAPPEKKQKVGETYGSKSKWFEVEVLVDDDDDDGEVYYFKKPKPPRTMEEISEAFRLEEEQLNSQLLIFTAPYESHDITHAIPIVVNRQDADRLCFDWEYLRSFHRECHDRRILQRYDHPGDPRPGGFEHCLGKDAIEIDRAAARFAIEQYNDLLSKTKEKEKGKESENSGQLLHLVELVKLGAQLDCHYMTLRAFNEAEKKEKIYQAVVVESDDDQFLLGMFRDVELDKVLAILQLDEGKGEDVAAGCCTSGALEK